MEHLLKVVLETSAAASGGLVGGALIHFWLHRGSVKVQAIERMIGHAPEILTKLATVLVQVLETAKAVKTLSK